MATPPEKKQRIPLHIGAPVWLFDNADMPDLLKVTGETTRSWVLSDGAKVPKAQAEPVFVVRGFRDSYYYLTKTAADDHFFACQSWGLSSAVKECRDLAVLKQIAALLGMPTGVKG